MSAAPGPQFGIFPTPEAGAAGRVVEQVRLAERLGLDLVGIQDHPYQRRFLDTWTLLSYLAGRTERIRLFPAVANLPPPPRGGHPPAPPAGAARQGGGVARPTLRRARRAWLGCRSVLGGDRRVE